MAKFRADFIDAGIAVNTTVAATYSSSGTAVRRHKILEFSIGVETPSDQTFRLTAQRFTAAGTIGAAVVPTALDYAIPGTATAEAFLGLAAEGAWSVEPTYTATLYVFNKVVSMRNPMTYYAPPDAEIIVPAVNANGVGWWYAAISSGTPAAVADMIIEEY
jgi:hypothetical protein